MTRMQSNFAQLGLLHFIRGLVNVEDITKVGLNLVSKGVYLEDDLGFLRFSYDGYLEFEDNASVVRVYGNSGWHHFMVGEVDKEIIWKVVDEAICLLYDQTFIGMQDSISIIDQFNNCG